jgi:myo-inositol 2-dehydrogenase/D-chiro-inositol 1-dehydrogenase
MHSESATGILTHGRASQNMKPVRFGLVGYGAWGQHHARAIAGNAGAELVAVVAHSPESRRAAHDSFKAIDTYADYRDLVARQDIDVVDVVLPNYLHFEAGAAVLSSGKHLLMEKPLALSVADCQELCRLAESEGKLLAVGLEMRLSELWGKMKKMLEQGAVGELRYACIELWRRPYRQGAQGWRYDSQRVGNWVLEEPIHFFDLARWYFAADPVSVYARASSKHPGHPELQDNFTAIVAFPQHGHAVIAQTLSAFEHHQTVKLTGTKGALWASWSGAMDRDLNPQSSLKHFDGQAVQHITLTRPTGEVFELEEEIASVVQAVRADAAPAATGVDGAWSVALCQAAQESIALGQAVPLSKPVW